MNALRLTVVFTGMVLLVSLPVAAQDKPGNQVTLRTVKYVGLAETITQNRGKVVVVDLWGYF